MKKFYKEDNQATPAIVFEVSAPIGFTEVTDHEELVELHKKRYEENERAGIEYCRNFTTEKYLEILDGTYTSLEVVTLEQYLNYMYEKIEGGHWLTAQGLLPTIPLSGIFDQAMKDRIQLDIDTYVNENY